MARNQSRRQARELAFQVLYSLFFAPAEDEAALRRSFVLSPHNLRMDESSLDDEPEGFAWDLTHGVWRRQGEIDGQINRFSHHWRTEKMGKIELTLLRIAVHELVWLRDSPPRTIINEALELADQFGASGAKQLINGILDAVAKTRDCPHFREDSLLRRTCNPARRVKRRERAKNHVFWRMIFFASV